MQTVTNSTIPNHLPSRTTRGRTAKVFLLIWILLIALGIAAAYKYSNELKQDLLYQLQHENQQQMTLLKSDYQLKFTELSVQVEELNSKVQSFNELLTFTKDNATNKTDNSNKLYTQLNEVKQQLTNLQKKMDLLK
jgi:uncharacterized protein HemX